MTMEKQNVVQDRRTPCKICENGHSEYVCPRCKLTAEKKASELSAFDPEKLAEEHK